jgi:hypothetical protein
MEEPLGAAYGFLVHYMGVTHGLVVEVRECERRRGRGSRRGTTILTYLLAFVYSTQHFKVRDVDGALPSSGDTAPEEEDTDQPGSASAGTSSSSAEDLASAHFPSFLEKCSFPHMEAKFGELRDNMGATSALLDVVRTWHTASKVLQSRLPDWLTLCLLLLFCCYAGTAGAGSDRGGCPASLGRSPL